ncbi:unnamed protein product, partial [marine sediment metagenome]
IHIFIPAYARRESSTEIRLYGVLYQCDASTGMAIDTVATYLRCRNGESSGPYSAGGAIHVTFETG